MRRSLIAALAVGGSLAVASSASAIQIPIGSPSDTPYSGSGTPTSIYSLYNASSDALILAENLIYNTGIDPTNFKKAFASPSDLSSTNVPEIATDFAVTASSNANNFYALDTAWCETPSADGGAGQSSGVCTSNGGVPPAPITAEFTGTVQPEVASAATGWPDLSQLVSFLGVISGSTLNSADGATVASSATVTSTTTPFAYSVTLNAPAGGYIVPSAFGLTFPAGLSVNAALVADEVNAASNTAAVELNPTGTSIGTVTLTSPLADEFGGSNNQLMGNVYVVTTGASSGQGSVTQPYLELWFPADGHPIYDLGAFPGQLSFPLTLSFGEAFVSLLNQQEPLPFSSVEISFPAATSPVKSSSCTAVATASGTITDSIADLAYEFGDLKDGVTSASGTPGPVAISGSATAVTDRCVKNTVTGSMSGLKTTHPTLRLKIKTGTAFGTVKVGLPKGLHFTKSKKLAKEVKAAGAKVKSVRIARGELVVALRKKVKSVTIRTTRPLISETAALVKSIKRHKTKKLSVSVHAGSIALHASIKA
jgi:hypothetical protein